MKEPQHARSGNVLHTLLADRLARIGLAVVVILLLVAALAPLIAGSRPIAIEVDGRWSFPALLADARFNARTDFKALHCEHVIFPPVPFGPEEIDDSVVDAPQGPTRRHLLGTDGLGRDVLARVVHGTAVSLEVGFIATGISLAIGVSLGALAGFHGGLVDEVIGRLIEVVQCFPSFFLILTVIAFLGPSVANVMVVIGLTSWTTVARLVRAECLSLRDREFVLAARALGASPVRILVRHVLPNAMAPVFVCATLGVAWAILVESALSYLGLGVQPPAPSWGNLISEGRECLGTCWWLWAAPGTMILVTVLAYNLVGEALRSAIDPRLRT